jgi:hypothetical protein
MKVRTFVSALGALGFLAVSHTSSATSYYWAHGINCKPYYGQYAQAGYGEPGIGNMSSSSSLRMFCSPEATSPAGATPAVSNIGVYVSDASTTSPLSCYVYAASTNWGTYWGATKYSCSQYGGCPDSTSSFTGQATLNWATPFSGTPIPVYLGTFDVGASCTLPPSASNASWIQHVALVAN